MSCSAPSSQPLYSVHPASSQDGTPRRQGSLAVWLAVYRGADLPYFVDALVRIITLRDDDHLTDTQQNGIIGIKLRVAGETVRQWRRGMSHPSKDRLFDLIFRASRVIGGEYELLVEIYGPDRASELWGTV